MPRQPSAANDLRQITAVAMPASTSDAYYAAPRGYGVQPILFLLAHREMLTGRVGTLDGIGGRVAIVFELVVNFGSNDAAARTARELVVSHGPLVVGGRDVGLHEPLLHRT